MTVEEFEDLLAANALTLGALRDLCLAFDRKIGALRPEDEEHMNLGREVFVFALSKILPPEELHRMSGVATKAIWDAQVAAPAVDMLFTHTVAKMVVKEILSSRDTVLDTDEMDEMDEVVNAGAALCAPATLRMLKEGADPALEESWEPVGAISDIKVSSGSEPIEVTTMFPDSASSRSFVPGPIEEDKL